MRKRERRIDRHHPGPALLDPFDEDPVALQLPWDNERLTETKRHLEVQVRGDRSPPRPIRQPRQVDPDD